MPDAPTPQEAAQTIAETLAAHEEQGWTCDQGEMPVYECACGDRSPAIDRDYIDREAVRFAADWHRAHQGRVILAALSEAGRLPAGEPVCDHPGDCTRVGSKGPCLQPPRAHRPVTAEQDMEALASWLAERWWDSQTGETDRWDDLDADEREAVAENSYANVHAEALAPLLAADRKRIAAEGAARALRDFADRFRPGDGNPWALHVRKRARRVADRIEARP